MNKYGARLEEDEDTGMIRAVFTPHLDSTGEPECGSLEKKDEPLPNESASETLPEGAHSHPNLGVLIDAQGRPHPPETCPACLCEGCSNCVEEA